MWATPPGPRPGRRGNSSILALAFHAARTPNSEAMSSEDETALREALEKEDALALARGSGSDELTRLKHAEELINIRAQRIRRKRIMTPEALVGYVAILGFFANAFQNWIN